MSVCLYCVTTHTHAHRNKWAHTPPHQDFTALFVCVCVCVYVCVSSETVNSMSWFIQLCGSRCFQCACVCLCSWWWLVQIGGLCGWLCITHSVLHTHTHTHTDRHVFICLFHCFSILVSRSNWIFYVFAWIKIINVSFHFNKKFPNQFQRTKHCVCVCVCVCVRMRVIFMWG